MSQGTRTPSKGSDDEIGSMTDSLIITASGRLTRTSGLKVGERVTLREHHSVEGIAGSKGTVTKVWTNQKTKVEWVKLKLDAGRVINAHASHCDVKGRLRRKPRIGRNSIMNNLVSPVGAAEGIDTPKSPPAMNKLSRRFATGGAGATGPGRRRDMQAAGRGVCGNLSNVKEVKSGAESNFSFASSLASSHADLGALGGVIDTKDRKTSDGTPKNNGNGRGVFGSSLTESVGRIQLRGDERRGIQGKAGVPASTESFAEDDGWSESDSSSFSDDDPDVFHAGTPRSMRTPHHIIRSFRTSRKDTKWQGKGVCGKWCHAIAKYKRGRSKLLNQYEIGKLLGEGAFGSVRCARDITTDRTVAVKKMVKSRLRKDLGGGDDNSQLHKVRTGLKAVAPLRHQHVLELIQVLDSPKVDTVYVITEYAEKGQIMEWNGKQNKYLSSVLGHSALGGIEIHYIQKVLREVVSGLKYMHSMKVTHGDVKPDNLLLSNDLTVKLSDFGSARSHKDRNPPVADGTYPFWSPEMAGSCPQKSDSYWDDTWAMSVTLYCMAFGDPPFFELNPIELFRLITTEQITIPARAEEAGGLSESPIVKELYDLISGALSLDKSKRLPLQKVASHPFLTAFDQKDAATLAPLGAGGQRQVVNAGGGTSDAKSSSR